MKILELKTERRRIGDIGERAAARYLFFHGYRIRKRNFVADGGEIDLIAENRSTIVFVEVKTRTLGKSNPSEARPASAVTSEKQRKIIHTSKFYFPAKNRGKHLRYDIIEVYLDENKKVQSLKHLPSAFNHDTAYR